MSRDEVKDIMDELKRKLNKLSKEELVDAILLSTAATTFILSKCSKIKVKPAESKIKKRG